MASWHLHSLAPDRRVPRWRKGWTSVGPIVTILIVVVIRAAGVAPVLTAGAAAVLAFGAAIVGLFVYGKHHGPRWREAWLLLAAGLMLFCVGGVLRAADPAGATFPSAADALAALGNLCAIAGLLRLLHDRAPGRAIEFLFEGLMGAVAVGLVVWAVSVKPVSDTDNGILALGPPLGLVVALWLALRLIWLTREHPTAYRYLVAAFLCLFTIDAMVAGSFLGQHAIPREQLASLELWAYCLWGAAGLHRSLRLSFEPVAVRPSRLNRGQLAFVLGFVLVGPLVFTCKGLTGESFPLPLILAGSSVLPVLVTVHLIRLVQDRASAEYRAQHDPLTGLPNRVLFHDRVDVALAHARRSNTRVSVMFLDLDRFKSINDSLGHAVGNQLLQAVSTRLRMCLRDADTVARIGGDEFTLLTAVADRSECAAVAERVLEAFRKPFVVGGRELVSSTSIGIAVFPEDGEDTETLLKSADTAMYRAKARGRGTFQHYTSDMSARARVKLSLETSLRNAIDRNELAVHYQPKIDVRTRRVIGVEALLRWHHPKLGSIPPVAFIRLAEETGLIVPLGEWVLREACDQMQRLWSAGLRPVPVSVNLSVRQVNHERVVDQISTALSRSGLAADLLEVEITESVFTQDMTATSQTLRRLRDMGIRCCLDDFGTGYSGLTYLAQMPIDSVKIDRSFVQSIDSTIDQAPIVEAVIALAQSLRMNVIAEGVETDQQALFLRSHGCDHMQGFLFSPPVPANELEQFLADVQAHATHTTRAPVPRQVHVERGLRARIQLIEPAASRRVTDVLHAVCVDREIKTLDEHTVAEILAALDGDTPIVPSPPSPLRTASMRLAVGTFAGLMPITSGVAAAGALPGPTQQLVASVFAPIGVEVPSARPSEPATTEVIAVEPAETPAGTPSATRGTSGKSRQESTEGDGAGHDNARDSRDKTPPGRDQTTPTTKDNSTQHDPAPSGRDDSDSLPPGQQDPNPVEDHKPTPPGRDNQAPRSDSASR